MFKSLIIGNKTTDQIADEAIRANGEKVCELCGEPYNNHPLITNVLDHNNEPYLRYTCDSLVIKL